MLKSKITVEWKEKEYKIFEIQNKITKDQAEILTMSEAIKEKEKNNNNYRPNNINSKYT